MSTETYDPPPPTDAEEDDDDDDDGCDFFEIICASCGIEFHVPSRWDDARRDDGRTFYCPNGHSLFYSAPMSEKLRQAQQEAVTAKSKVEQLEAALEAKNPSAWKKWIGGK